MYTCNVHCRWICIHVTYIVDGYVYVMYIVDGYVYM